MTIGLIVVGVFLLLTMVAPALLERRKTKQIDEIAEGKDERKRK